jgi:hypothetical protein
MSAMYRETTYREDADTRERQITGGFVIGTASVVAAVAVILSLYAWISPPGQVPPPRARHSVTFGDRYLAIAGPADRQLAAEESEFTANERSNLTAAKSDLMAEVATLNSFDKRLSAIAFPAAAAAVAHSLIRARQSQARLLTSQARSASLARLRSFNKRDQAAEAAAAAEANLLRKALHLPASSG